MKLFHGQWLNVCLMVVYLTLTILLSNFLFQTQTHLQEEQMHYASLWDGKQVYATYDTLYEHVELEKAYLNEAGSQLRVQRYLDALEAETRFPYYICGAQNLVLDAIEIPDSCCISESAKTTAKAHQISQHVMCDFAPDMDAGTVFSDEDYLWQYGDTVPVILGYAWRNRMQVGDTFHGKLMGLSMQFRVIGIAGENTYFPLFDHLTYEDDFIIMPTLKCLEAAETDDEDFLQKAMALQNVAGYFRLDESQGLSELVTYLDTKIQQFGMFEVKIMRVDQARLLILAVSSDRHRSIYMGLMIALGLCAVLSMVTLSQSVVRKNARMLAIYYLAGEMPWKISMLVIGQGILIDAFAWVLSILLAVVLFPTLSWFHPLMPLLLGGSMCLCTIPALRMFFKNPIAYLKKE